ncbi:hypothetical protein AUP74_02331 [Microbulbifer aggregans]|uniref:DUF3429 domain-containing protein n=1 Tax=Microbulbifer aggregans TaxID=1769779 RepID=A0A1C9W9A9_9GAMM|nr:DUF3429 domain-containing protein [Microbulbifer aggregans]AOS97739.1 hypothetical protein AUP74_02331 [Microbulbifer aggregans]
MNDSLDKPPPTEPTPLFDALAYAGILPFVLGIWLQWRGGDLLGVEGHFLFAAYSACILSFLGGIWWGGALNGPNHPRRLSLTLQSNGVALLAWLGLLLSSTLWGFVLLALGFAYVRWEEARLNPNARRLRNYFRTRSRVSYLVILCHLVMVLLLLWRGGVNQAT